MKKIVISLATVVLLGVGAFSYKVYDNYQTRESKINHVLKFQKIAFAAYANLMSAENKKAVKLYEKAVGMYDKDIKTMLDYSTALSNIGESKKAVGIYEKAYNLAKYKNESILSKLAAANYAEEDYDKALHYYKEAIERFRPKYRYVEKIILVLDKQGKTEEAMRYFAYIQEKSPNYFKDKKEFEKFANLYTVDIEAKDLLPEYDNTTAIDELLALGQKYEKKGLDDKALKAYDKVLYQDVENQKANFYIAELLLRYDDYTHALVHLEKLKNKDYESLLKLGTTYHQLKEYEMAVEVYEEALKHKESPTLYKNLAACLFKNGNIKKSVEYLVLLKQIDPRMAYNFEHAIFIDTGKQMSLEDELRYHALNTWYDLKDFLTKEESKNDT